MLKNIFQGVVIIGMLDLLILFGGLAQVGLEGRTGYWAPFWRVQAEFIINLLS